MNGKGTPCKKTDLVNVINVPLIAAVDLIKSLPPIPLHYKPFTTLPSALLKILDFILFNRESCKVEDGNMSPLCDDLFYTAPVDDFLWQGHNPGIINLVFVVVKVIDSVVVVFFGPVAVLANSVVHFEKCDNHCPPVLLCCCVVDPVVV